jgi:molecular chaperone DnaK
VHEFEELEESVAGLGDGKSALEPPRTEFEKLVGDCIELNTFLGRSGVDRDVPHDHQEMARSIEVQRDAGERAYQAADQNSYGDAIRQLTNYRDHLIALAQRTRPRRDLTETERAIAILRAAQEETGTVRRLAQSAARADLVDEIDAIQRQLEELGGQIEHRPVRVQERGSALRARLEQLKNVLSQAPRSEMGKVPEDHSGNQEPR